MAIEEKWWPWKPSLFNQYRIRIANELRLAQRHEYCNELRRQIALAEEDITQILKQMTPIDFAQIDQKINSCITLCQIEQKRTLNEYRRVKKQLIHLAPKLLIGNAYLCARDNYNDIPIKTLSIKKKIPKQIKLTIEQKWRKGIADAYRRLQTERDKEEISKYNKSLNTSIPIEPLPITNEYPFDEPPIITENIIDEIKENEFVPPLPPLLDESNGIIIPFKTPPPIVCRSPTSDRLQFAVDDTIVKPHRLANKTLGNISHMSFHIEPDQCSSPKPNDKKKRLKQLMPPPPPPPPLFSSTAIFDTHAFFTQTNNKTKKQKKKIDISRQPVIMTTNNIQKKKIRKKKTSLYDFQDDDNSTLSSTKGKKLLTDDIITARFAKNSHYHSHQTSMASNKSSKSQHKSNEREHKKRKKNILGIGTSSPLTLSSNLTLSPGRLSTDDKDDNYEIKSSLSRRHNRTKTTTTTNKSKRTRVK